MAQYPTSAAGDQHLYVAVNNKSTTLVGALTATGGNYSGTEIEVSNITGFPSTGFITIDLEAISYTGVATSPHRFTGIVRGQDGTVAASHSNGATVYHHEVAAHHNALKEEVKAIELDLINSVKPNVFENLLINGGFEIWQRGTSFPITTAVPVSTYHVDRWKTIMWASGSSVSYTISREATEIDTGLYSLKCQVTSAGTARSDGRFMYYTFEPNDARALRNKTLTVSMRVKSNTSEVNIGIGDNSQIINSANHTGDNTWQTLTASITVGPTATAVFVWSGYTGANLPLSTVFVDSAMLVFGSSAKEFSRPKAVDELIRCQRYYEKSYATDVAPGTSDSNTVVFNAAQVNATPTMRAATYTFKVEKYSTPTITLYRQDGTAGQLNWISTGGTSTNRVSTTPSITRFGFNVGQTAAVEYYAEGHFTASSEV